MLVAVAFCFTLMCACNKRKLLSLSGFAMARVRSTAWYVGGATTGDEGGDSEERSKSA
jgi:hypothetical protein